MEIKKFRIKKILSTGDVARMLGVTRQWVHMEIKNGRLKATKLHGRSYIVDYEDLLRYLKLKNKSRKSKILRKKS